MTADQQNALSRHILSLAERHHIAVEWRKSGLYATAHNEGRCRRYVRIPHPTTPFAYAVGLHELGHLIAPHGWWAPRIDREATAWAWAFEHSALPITPRIRAAVRRRLDNYLTHGPDYRLRRPKPGAAFWAFYASLPSTEEEMT